MTKLLPQPGERVEWFHHGSHHTGTVYEVLDGRIWVGDGSIEIPAGTDVRVILPFLVVDVAVSIHSDYGSASLHCDTCIVVRTVEDGKRLAELLSNSPDLRPSRLMYPNEVLIDYSAHSCPGGQATRRD
jgi:hypothetical protein